ncbi:MAG: type IV toxin-antitoxin system AbiEi family antitoxin domain-containing protein [Clostridiales bacterium]|nr:type IV toxin-antitoxin system AbiEi family antitoxin domain-containing protein [Clostridiales bacterium]
MNRLNNNDMIETMINSNNGFVTAAQVTAAGIQRRTLGELVKAKRLYRAGRGIYARPDAWEDEMYFLQYRFAKGVFSNETALYLHGLSDRTPHTYTLTFPHGYNAAGLKKQNAKAKFAQPEIFDLGITEVKTPFGNPIRAYDVERTLCDIVKGNNSCDIQLVNQAMKAYAASKEKDIAKLVAFAERLHVKPKILRYMEVLL